MTQNILEIQAEIARLQAKAEDLKKKGREKALSDIVAQMQSFGITLKDLNSAMGPGTKRRGLGKAKVSKPARKRSSKVAGTKVAPKFRGPAGETWTGRGVMPKWLDVLVKAGQPKEAFLIKQDSAA